MKPRRFSATLPAMWIATWNVNSIRARHERVMAWLKLRQPEVVCLQELKTQEENYPFKELEELGYHSVVHGQKTYNGVAILSRTEPSEVFVGLDDGVDDPQARLVAATVRGVRVVSVYVPNGSTMGSDKWAYKLAWYDRLRAWLDRHESPDRPLVVGGDYNVAPAAIDVHDPQEWEPGVLFHPLAREALERVMDFGLHDVVREMHPGVENLFSWWDYRMLGFPKNRGLRIDHLLATKSLMERCKESFIDREERKGKSPSDHAPVLARFDVEGLES